MKTKRLAKYSLGAVCAVMLLTNTSWAAPAADANEDVLDNIVITATKTEADVRDLPANVTVITAEDIARANVKSVEDILRYQTGFFVRDMSGTQATKISMRGMNQSGVLVMVDGISVNNGYTGGANWASVPVNMIERIEIVRGAASALYGSNAMGGVVNIITKQTTGGEMKIGFGADHTRYGDFNYGVKDNDLFFSVNYGKRTTDGYNDNINRKPNNVNYGPRETEREWYGVKLAYDVDEYNKAIFNYQVNENKYGYYKNLAPIKQRGERKAITTQFGWQGRYEDGSALNVNLSEYKLSKYNTWSSWQYNPNPVKSREADANYSWYAGDKHHITVGVSIKRDEADGMTVAIADKKFGNVTTPAGTILERSGGTTETKSFYLQDDIKLSDVTNLVLGGRYDSWKLKDAYDQTGSVDDAEESQFSPKAALNYKANEVTSYYVSVGKGFNSPNIFNLTRLWPQISSGLDNPPYLYPNINLKPETLMMYEVGAKFNVNDKTTATVSIYQNDIDDMIGQLACQARPGDPTGNAKNSPLMWENIGKARVQGFEAEINHRFDDHYDAFLSYTFADSEVREYSDPKYIGNQLALVPKHELKMGVNWQKAKWSANLLGRYTSKVYEDMDNTDSLANTTDAVFLADIKVGYAFDNRQSVAVAVDNIFDREYQSRGYLGNGRAAYLEYSYQF